MPLLDILRELVFPSQAPNWQERRDKRVFENGSPFYTYELPVLAAATWTGPLRVDALFPDARKYEPLDYIEVINNGAVDLTLEVDNGETFPVPAGTVRGNTDKPFRQFRIRNDHAADVTVAAKVYILMQKRPTSIDRWARGERE